MFESSHVLINLVGDVALLLWGIHMVHTGILRAFGSDLRHVLNICLGNRFAAFLAGAGVTAVLQSSTATGLMATSFAAAGVVDLVPALAIMLGANVGTTLIVQVLSFDAAVIAPILIAAGVFAFRRGGQTRTRDLGRVGIGLGLMLLSLHLLIQTVAPTVSGLAGDHAVAGLLRDPLLVFVIAAILTWAAHSSVAIVLLVVSLAGAGVIAPVPALAMVLGANVGSALNPVLEGAGRDPVKRRLPVGNLINRLVGCALIFPLLTLLPPWLGLIEAAPGRMVANFHTLFNLAMAALFILPLGLFAKGLERLLPEADKPADPGTPQHLDTAALAAPAVALANAAREALRMTDIVETMLKGSQALVLGDDRKRVVEISRMDDILDRLHKAIERYLTDVSPGEMSEGESRRMSDILSFIINLEHIGDIVDKNLMEIAAKRIKNQVKIPAEAAAELDEMHARLIDHLRLAVAVFMSGDTNSARRLFEGKERFRELERAATERHFIRIRDGLADSIATSGLHLDMIRDLKRIDAHLAAIAQPILSESGLLKASRLAS